MNAQETAKTIVAANADHTVNALQPIEWRQAVRREVERIRSAQAGEVLPVGHQWLTRIATRVGEAWERGEMGFNECADVLALLSDLTDGALEFGTEGFVA